MLSSSKSESSLHTSSKKAGKLEKAESAIGDSFRGKFEPVPFCLFDKDDFFSEKAKVLE